MNVISLVPRSNQGQPIYVRHHFGSSYLHCTPGLGHFDNSGNMGTLSKSFTGLKELRGLSFLQQYDAASDGDDDPLIHVHVLPLT